MSLSYGDAFNEKYLDKSLVIINMAAQMSVDNLASYENDPDSQDFCKELREEILEQYTTILISVGDSDNAQIKAYFKSNLNQICNFVSKVIHVDGLRNVQQMEAICELIKDMATQYQEDRALIS